MKMQQFPGSRLFQKLASFARAIRSIENWPTAVDLRLRPKPGRFRLLRLRSGLNVICRDRTIDWDVIRNLALDNGVERSMSYLRSLPGSPIVLDIGANIGLFSLIAAAAHPKAVIYAFEPGPMNARMIELNQRLNPTLSDRVHLRFDAVAGTTRMAEFFYDDVNPQGSGLNCTTGRAIPVQVRSLAEIVESLPDSVAF